MIHIGVNQDVFYRKTGGFPAFEDMIRGVADLGLNLYEFCPEYPEQTPAALTRKRRREAVALANSLDVRLIVHASFFCTNICLIHDGMRKEAVRQLKREIELAHDLESDVITIHPGPPGGHSRWYPEEDAWEMMARSYEELLKCAGPLGVRVCTENMVSTAFPSASGTLACIERIFAMADVPHFGLTFDFGHHNLIHKDLPIPERTEKAIEILRRFRERIWVLHIHDNKGERDDHAAVGTGQLDYDALMPEIFRLRIQAYWSMELYGWEAIDPCRRGVAAYAERAPH
jgi:sugar phosphate isomerase/epimerase